MQLRFDEWSKLEFKEARAWYAAIRPALGRAFADEVKLAGQRIVHMPQMYPLETGDIRRCVLNRFPCILRYALRGDIVLIVAVSHQHRAPGYWVDRIPHA